MLVKVAISIICLVEFDSRSGKIGNFSLIFRSAKSNASFSIGNAFSFAASKFIV
jgi:hypothetical protein